MACEFPNPFSCLHFFVLRLRFIWDRLTYVSVPHILLRNSFLRTCINLTNPKQRKMEWSLNILLSSIASRTPLCYLYFSHSLVHTCLYPASHIHWKAFSKESQRSRSTISIRQTHSPCDHHSIFLLQHLPQFRYPLFWICWCPSPPCRQHPPGGHQILPKWHLLNYWILSSRGHIRAMWHEKHRMALFSN